MGHGALCPTLCIPCVLWPRAVIPTAAVRLCGAKTQPGQDPQHRQGSSGGRRCFQPHSALPALGLTRSELGVGCGNLRVNAWLLHGGRDRGGGHPHLGLIQEPQPHGTSPRIHRCVLKEGRRRVFGAGEPTAGRSPAQHRSPHGALTQPPAPSCPGLCREPGCAEPIFGAGGDAVWEEDAHPSGAAVQRWGCGSSGVAQPSLSQSPICCHRRL